MRIKPLLSQTPTLPIGFIRQLPVFGVGDNYNGDGKGVMLSSKCDNDTVLEFLSEYKDSPRTYKAYSKELERLLLWLEIKKVSISAFMPVHWQEYLDFIKKPMPVKLWVGKRAAKFLVSGDVNPSWKVFTGKYEIDPSTKRERLISFGLSDASVPRVKAIIGSYFSYLTNGSYLIKDPTKLGRLMNKKSKDTQITKRIKKRLIRPQLIEFVLGVLGAQAKIVTDDKKFYAIRARFVIAVFINSGLRISELAHHKMSDIKRSQINIDDCYLDIRGKGDKEREISLEESTLDIIRDYRNEIGLGYSLPLENEDTPLVPRIDTRTTIGETQLHKIVKLSFKHAASVLSLGILSMDLPPVIKAIIDNDISTLEIASAHWLRHSYATWLQNKYKDLNKTMRELGHDDVSTTMRYQHISDGIVEDSDTAKEVQRIYDEIVRGLL